MRREVTRVTDYLFPRYGISLAGPVGIVGSGNSQAITPLIETTADRLDVHYRVHARAQNRCGRAQGILGEAYRNMTWICWGRGSGPETGSVASRFVIAHEYMHLVQSDLSGNSRGRKVRKLRDNGPAWLVEGHATWAAADYLAKQGQISRPNLETMRRWAADQTMQLSQLDSGIAMRSSRSYDVGQVAVAALAARSGPQATFDFFRRIGRANLSRPRSARVSALGWKSSRRHFPSWCQAGRRWIGSLRAVC